MKYKCVVYQLSITIPIPFKSHIKQVELYADIDHEYISIHSLRKYHLFGLDSIAVSLFSNQNYSETSKLVYSALAQMHSVRAVFEVILVQFYK